jgi:hypothetical protein
MNYTTTYDIRIASYRITRIEGLEVTSSTSRIEDTAEISLPTSSLLKSLTGDAFVVDTARAIQVGDEVEISVGYNDVLRTEFVGYVSKIDYTTPVKIYCEDAIYKLRRKLVNKAWTNTSLKGILNYILEGTNIKLVEDPPTVNISPFTIKKENAAKALKKISDEYGLIMYFTDRTSLFVGYKTLTANFVKYYLGGVKSNVISPNLKYRSASDTTLSIKAISIKPDNTKIETIVGDEGGDVRTLHYYNISSEQELIQLAEKELEKYKFDGYEGGMQCFLQPFAKAGYTAILEDFVYPDRGGRYFIDQVKLSCGQSGCRRNIQLGIKV